MGVSKFGDWDKVTRLIDSLDKECKKVQKKCLMRWGLQAERISKQHITNQDLNWTALKIDYVEWKKRQTKPNLSEKILIATGSYLQSITSYVINDTVYVGVRKSAKDDKGNDIALIARVHEYGYHSLGIPERPLWKPTLEETLQWHVANNDPAKMLIDNLKNK